MLRLANLVLFTTMLTACVSPKIPAENKTKPDFMYCPEQRPQVCTMDYRPVCATRDTGVRCVTTPCPATEQKTYSNDCSACADINVIGHIIDACPPSSKNRNNDR